MNNPVYSVVYHSRVQVLRRLSESEAAEMREEEGVTSVALYTEDSHYFPSCGGVERKGLSRSLSDTTCKDCLQERANDLAGWRWEHPGNAEDVDYIKSFGIVPTVQGLNDRPVGV